MKLPYLDTEQLMEDLAELANIGGDGKGVNRTAYSPADLEGRRWIEQKMGELELDIRTDEAGNMMGVYPGTARLPPIGIGSHSDTVPEGGAYDGALGVLAAVAAVRALKDADMKLRHPVEIINFAAEEATMAGGTTGSQAMTGIFDLATLDEQAWDGRLVRTHLAEAGLEPEAIVQAKRSPGSLAAFLELHVEQSDNLEQAQLPIAIVEGIVSIRRYAVVFEGYANHAGTTSMSRRQDALVAAAPYILLVRDLAVEYDIVGTVGKLDVSPGASNVIPGRVEIVVEIRGLDAAVLDAAEDRLQRAAESASATFTRFANKPPVECDARVMRALEAACERLGLRYLKMASGAGHDAMNTAALCPTGLFFVPSVGGVSHSPDEYTRPEDCINGAQVLLAALIELDTLI